MSEWLSNLHDLESMTAGTIYVVVIGMVFVESGLLVGFFLPGDTVLFAAGLLAADPDRGLSLPLLVTGIFIAAVLGDAVGYWSGRRLGRPWLMRRAARWQRNVERAERFYEKYGALAVVVARFIPWVRTFTPIVAGVGRMPYPTFLVANVAGAVLWGIGITTLGYVAYSDPGIRTVAYVIAGTAVALSVLVPVFHTLRRRLSRERPAPAAAAGSEPGPADPAPADPEQPDHRS